MIATPAAPTVAEVLIGEAELHARVQALGEQIGSDYADSQGLSIIGLLKGATFFVADLLRAIPYTVPVTLDFLAISSYNREDGGVRIVSDIEHSITGRDVVLVKSIIDTGLSVGYVMRILRTRRPLSLRLCILLDRRSVRLLDLPIHYRGFTIPDHYVVGYGLDAHEQYRNLPYIGVLAADVNKPYQREL